MPNSSSYDIINGRKYKKCKTNQIRNPKTNRCVNIKANKIKTCPEGKILNPKTNRCVKINKNNNKKPNLFKKLFYPFINRVNANINDRIKYNNLLLKTLDINESKNYCMKLYKFNTDKKPLYRLGNKIVLKKQIGTESVYGIVFLSSFRDTYNKIFKYAIKIMLDTKENNNEIIILKDLTKAVLNRKCPHFPILYATLKCDKNIVNTQSSYIKSSNNITKKRNR